MTLQDAAANVGRAVVYRHGPSAVEEGVITSVNDRWVFVRYGSDKNSKATLAQMLEFVGGSR